ncbi:MAG: hypothetical protein WBD63_06400 [Phycisphaerae bacterium]|nr:hypothetical protein [Phycisphaerae bacterium]
MRLSLVVLALGAASASAALPAFGAEPAPGAGVIAVFPFTSPDDSQAGGRFSDSLRLRAKRLGLVVVDPLSLAEAMSGAEMPGPETAVPQAAELVRERLGANLALWGEVHPHGEGLRVEVRGLDLRSGTVEALAESFSVARPQDSGAVQDAILERLTGLAKRPVPEATPEADARVPTVGPNLVANGDFEAGNISPDAWQRMDGLTTFWVAGESPAGKCLKMNTDVYHDQWVEWQKQVKAGAPAEDAPAKTPTSGAKYDTVAGTYGVAYFSDPIPVTPEKSYKVEVDYRGGSVLGGGIEFFPKLFIRGYGEVAGEKRTVYDAYLALRCRTDGTQWEHGIRIVTIPTDTQAPVEFVRVMLYAYWPPGLYWFDNVSMKEVSPGATIPTRQIP